MGGKQWVGLSLLLVVVVIALGIAQIDWSGLQRDTPERLEPVTVKLYYGGEKSAFLNDAELTELLQKKYKLRLDAHKAGSVEMVSSLDTKTMDCLWPSNQIAVELARASGKTVLDDQNIFNSPVVFYAWDKVTDALVKAGIDELREGAYYVVNLPKLIHMIIDGKRWKEDLGLNVYGPVKIFSTDPRKSNSGNMWAGLLANLLNGGTVVTAETLPEVLPELQKYFRAMGYMEHSSGDIFENFLSQGMGPRPIIVGYENQLVELVLAHPESADYIKDKIRILYPEPTVFSSHPLISLKPACKRLVTALQDKEVQTLAWRAHGFRSGLMGVENDPSVLSVAGIPSNVDLVIPLPRATEMQAIIDSLN